MEIVSSLLKQIRIREICNDNKVRHPYLWYTGANNDWTSWVFRFRTFNLNHSWILSQLSYERVLTSEVFSKPPCLIAKINLENSVQLVA